MAERSEPRLRGPKAAGLPNRNGFRDYEPGGGRAAPRVRVNFLLTTFLNVVNYKVNLGPRVSDIASALAVFGQAVSALQVRRIASASVKLKSSMTWARGDGREHTSTATGGCLDHRPSNPVARRLDPWEGTSVTLESTAIGTSGRSLRDWCAALGPAALGTPPDHLEMTVP